jgi:hypothetical protein
VKSASWLSLPIWKAAGIALLSSIAILLIAFLVSLPFAKDAAQLANWVQATGTVMAIIGGVVGVLYQVETQRQAKAEDLAAVGRAAHSLAASAYALVTDRLNSALQPGKSDGVYSLRGTRTTEMISSLREFEVGLLPTRLITPFVTLRSCVHAINTRIFELYREEGRARGPTLTKLKAARPKALSSAVRVHVAAGKAYEQLNAAAIQECAASARTIIPEEPLRTRRGEVTPEALAAGSLGP